AADGEVQELAHERVDLMENLIAHVRDRQVPLLSSLASTGAFSAVLEAIQSVPDPLPIETGVDWVGEGPAAHPVVDGIEEILRSGGRPDRVDPALRLPARAPVQRARLGLAPGGRGAALGPARRDLTGAAMTAHTVHQVLEALTTPDPAARPMMRWWWFGPDLDRGEIDRELRAMAAAGLGGAEVALVYPLRPGAPHYLSPEVLSHLRHA